MAEILLGEVERLLLEKAPSLTLVQQRLIVAITELLAGGMPVDLECVGEMLHLYPRLSAGGVLIIDDYGHWAGARKAIDEYIAENKLRVLLNRIDYTARIAVKIDSDES